MFKIRRLGVMRVPLQWLEDRPSDVIAATEGCLILRAEAMVCGPWIEYQFAHLSLDPVPEGETLPLYDVIIRGGLRDRFERRAV